MMDPDDPRLHVRSVPPAKLLRTLAAMQQRRRSGETVEVPSVTVYLRGAVQFTGEVVAASGKSLALSLETGESCWLELNQVTAVVLRVCSDNVNWFGADAPYHTGTVPTRLDLQRQARHLRKSLSGAVGRQLSLSIDWGTFGQNDEILSALGVVLDNVSEILQQWVLEADDPSLFGQHVRMISVCAGDLPGVELQEETLRICGAFEGDRVVFLEAEELTPALIARLKN